MITLSAVFWLVAGVVTGLLHGAGLRHSAASATPWMAVTGLLRLFLVAALLTTAAVQDCLFSGFAGWVGGFAASVAFLYWRVRANAIQDF